MDRNWNVVVMAGLAVCFGLSSAGAGEPIVRQFGDWTVTITPKNARSRTVESPVKPAKQRVPESAPAEQTDRRLVIRPVSYEQTVALNDEPVAQPAPTPEAVAPAPVPVAPAPAPAVTEPAPAPAPTAATEVVPAREASIVPSLSPTPETIPPAPVPSSATKPVCENCGLPTITPKRRDHDEVPPVVVPQTANYRDIYFSIPFIRAEYDANPSYRHDATMEFMFNQMRPTVIQRGTTNVNHYDRGYGYDGYGFGWDPPYYPFSYGLRIHRSR